MNAPVKFLSGQEKTTLVEGRECNFNQCLENKHFCREEKAEM